MGCVAANGGDRGCPTLPQQLQGVDKILAPPKLAKKCGFELSGQSFVKMLKLCITKRLEDSFSGPPGPGGGNPDP